MAQAIIHTFFNQLLAKAIIKISRTRSPIAVNAILVRQHKSSEYILKVLNAPENIRTAVREEAVATPGPEVTQLAAILTAFEALEGNERADFIRAFEACSMTVDLGAMDVIQDNSWQGGHIPPHYEP